MSKDAIDRLTETVTFIKTKQPQSDLNAEQFGDVTDDLDHWMSTASAAKKIKLSGLMHKPASGAHVSHNKEARKFLRAGVMIDCALVFPENQWGSQSTIQLGLGEYSDNKGGYKASPQFPFQSACLRARDAVYSQPTNVSLMLANLRADPVGLLNEYKFIVNGGSKQGNPLTYGVTMHNGAWKFDCYITSGYQIKAVNVQATKYNDIKDNPDKIVAVNSSVHEASDLLLTTQFTGCSFCFMKSPDGQNLLAAHIDPGKSKTFSGKDLSKIMREKAGFTTSNGGDLKAYGRVGDKSGDFGYPESAAQMIIVGVRKGTDWRLYSQITSLDGSLTAQRIDE